MSSKPTRMRKAVAVGLMAAVGSFYTLVPAGVLAQTGRLSGELSSRGAVMVNGATAASGATVLSEGRVKTGKGGAATINLGKQGQIELGSESELMLKLEEGKIGGELRAGRAVVSAPVGVAVAVATGDGVAASDGAKATTLTVDVACGNTRVSSQRSEAKVTAGNRVEYVAAGQEVAVGTQAAAVQGDRCPRLTAAAAKLGGGTLHGAGLAALILAGVGGAVAGIVAASQSDSTAANANVSGSVSTFRP